MNATVFLLSLIVLTITPASANEAEKQPGDNASESGKNEIPICKKLVPIDVVISPEFIDNNRAEEQKKGDESVEAGDEAGDEEGSRVEALKKYEVTKRLEYAIACELERQGYAAAKPIQLKGTITNFRLHSGEAAIAAAIVGLTAGWDKLAMKVDVLVPGDKPYQFSVSVSRSTGKGGFRMPVPSQRLNYVVQKVSKDVIKKVMKEGFIKEPYALSSGSQFLSMSDSIATGNREILLRITKSLSQQREPVDITILDRVADRIYSSQMETDSGMADTLAHMCKLLGKSNNGKYKQLLHEISKKAAHKTLRKYAALTASSLPDTNEPQYVPMQGRI